MQMLCSEYQKIDYIGLVSWNIPGCGVKGPSHKYTSVWAYGWMRIKVRWWTLIRRDQIVIVNTWQGSQLGEVSQQY